MRHARAEESAQGGDSFRRLTEQGRREALEAGLALRDRNEGVSLILSSPRIRARETADRVAAALGGSARIQINPGLTCGATIEAYWDVIRSEGAGGALLLVAHNPDLSAFATSIIHRVVGFSPATLCCMEMDGSQGSLVWIRHPNP